MTTLGPETIKTYRYVRISLIAGVALLFCALAVHIVGSGGALEASISAYFYLPVRSVLVGTLVGASLALIAIQGRPGGEDALLNLAGMLFLLVAFVPTPVSGLPGAPCPRRDTCVPEQFVADVEVSVAALLWVGALGLLFTGWTLWRRTPRDPVARKGFLAAALVWVTTAVMFGPSADWPLRGHLLDLGHYVAAVLAFVLLITVAVINARRSDHGIEVAGRRASYTALYGVVALLMGIGTVVALAYWWVALRPVPDTGTTVVFWLEAWLLLLFATFWALQTKEHWHEGLPADAVRGS